MEELGTRETGARTRNSRAVLVARWAWVLAALVGLTSFVCHNYELASLAGYTSTITLFVAAFARRAARHKKSDRQSDTFCPPAVDTFWQEAIY